MALWAIVPVKPLRRGKSRLAEVLSQDERVDLNRRLLSHTLDTLTAIPEIEQVIVISRDQEALSLAREYGARTVQEGSNARLNVALRRATIVAQSYTTRGVLIVPADLPLITPEDIRIVLKRAIDPPVVVLAPDRRGRGTNIMFICPVGIIDYEFGPGSFKRHCELAIQAGARLEICELPSLALDMDLPEDLEMVSETFEGIIDKSIEDRNLNKEKILLQDIP
jgi:2-phospho-L-lactate guanylyltransferase